ncbi:MAG: hypothetical protein NXI17_05890 [Alphaproteobacteria bacterium]|nr:hypothetical protein [Alphaproteobacteria bacterium]
MTWTPFNKFTDEELIREFRTSDDPAVQEFVLRLADTIDNSGFEIDELKDEIADLEKASCEGCAELKAKQEEREDEHGDKVAELEEQLAHECTRIDEFHAENRQFIAEIERLKTITTPNQEEPQMLEQQIEKLTERVGAVESKQDKTNELLADILDAIRDSGSVPPATAKVAKAPKSTRKVELVADNDTGGEVQQEKVAELPKGAEPETVETSVDDARDALLGIQERHGREAAVKIVEQFTGGTRKLSDIPADKYSDVLAACEARDEKAAA